MGQRKVYIDFVDGNGYIDISDFVKYDTLSIQETAFNDTFHAAQNTCSFSVIYDSSIYTKLTTSTVNCPIRIFDLREGATLHTEADQPILTESGIRLLIETSVAVPVFTGHIPPQSSREYNGILDNTVIKLNATDDMDYFDLPIGDVICTNCAVMNPADPANSIVHRLALIAGWSSAMVSAVSIPTVISRFAPPEETTSVRSILDTLLYEYGYTLFLNENGDLAPVQWDRAMPTGTVPEFNEDNIIKSIPIDHALRKYDGVKVVYYSLSSVDNMRLYRDANCGYASDGSFAGYAILDATDYPPAANVIDETTGNKQIVYQEYTDDAIKYATNKAIQQNLDYNYKNYSSDFTSIVATENHYVDRRYQAGITIVTEIFGNKKCQLLYRNTSGSSKLLYYNDVYGTVWYKSAERTAIKNIATTPSDVYTYTSSYIFDKAIGDELALAIAAQYKNGLKTYEASSEKDYFCGDMVRIVLSGEGTDTYALIQNKAWNEKEELYTYTCVSYSPTREAITSQNVIEVGTLNPAESFASVHTIGTPEAVAATVQPIVSEYAPKYLGIGILNGVAVRSFTGASVNNNGVITVGTDVAPNEGDWMVNYSATNVALGMYVWRIDTWIITTNVELISAAAIDLCNLQVGGITIDGFTTFTTAIIKTLFTQQINVLDPGFIQSSNYTQGKAGFKISSDGSAELNNLNVDNAVIYGAYCGMPCKIGTSVTPTVDITFGSYLLSVSNTKLVVLSLRQNTNKGTIGLYRWNGTSFVLEGSVLTNGDSLDGAIPVVIDATTILATGSVLTPPSTVTSGFIRYVLSAGTWSVSQHRVESLAVNHAMFYDGSYVYLATISNTVGLSIQKRNKDTLSIIETSNSLAIFSNRVGCPNGVYLGNGLFAVMGAPTTDIIYGISIYILRLENNTLSIVSRSIIDSTYPYGRGVLKKLGATDLLLSIERSVGSTENIRKLIYYKVNNGIITEASSIELPATLSSSQEGMTTFTGSQVALTRSNANTLELYALGFSLGTLN